LAGLFGGPATSLSFSIIADVVPVERRGKATGAVMGAFSAASVVGIPMGLELARTTIFGPLGGWRAPFFGVAAIGLLVALAAVWLLPPMRHHLQGRFANEPPPSLRQLLAQPTVRVSYAMTAVVMMAGFILIPNISAWVQNNQGLPRAQLSRYYFGAGIVSFFATRYAGVLVDNIGSFKTGTLAAAGLIWVQYNWFYDLRLKVPLVVLFCGFMLALGVRNVAYNTLTSKVPSPRERARFMSIQSAVQHSAAALGAFSSARLLTERPDGGLEGMRTVALLAMGLSSLVPGFLFAVERRVRRAKQITKS
jgi:predicted MFS family arabinose efflux permease